MEQGLEEEDELAPVAVALDEDEVLVHILFGRSIYSWQVAAAEGVRLHW